MTTTSHVKRNDKTWASILIVRFSESYAWAQFFFSLTDKSYSLLKHDHQKVQSQDLNRQTKISKSLQSFLTPTLLTWSLISHSTLTAFSFSKANFQKKKRSDFNVTQLFQSQIKSLGDIHCATYSRKQVVWPLNDHTESAIFYFDSVGIN